MLKQFLTCLTLSVVLASGSSLAADVIYDVNFDTTGDGGYDYGYIYGGTDNSNWTTSRSNTDGVGGGSGFTITADLSTVTSTGTFDSGFGGGLGAFGPMARRPDSLSNFDIEFDVNFSGLDPAFTDPNIIMNATVIFRYPDNLADGDDSGNDFADNIFQLAFNGISYDIATGGFQTLSANGDDAIVVTGDGSSPQNRLLTFAEFQNGTAAGDPDTVNPGKSWADVSEVQIAFNVSSGGAFGQDANNSVTIDNIQFSQAVPEPGTMGLISLIGLGLVARRRRGR